MLLSDDVEAVAQKVVSNDVDSIQPGSSGGPDCSPGQLKLNMDGPESTGLDEPSSNAQSWGNDPLKPGLITDSSKQSRCNTMDIPIVSLAPSLRDACEQVSEPEAAKAEHEEILPGVPTEGSVAHYFGTCKPCVFVFKNGCKNGPSCTFCHLCQPGEKKQRKMHKREMYRYRKAFEHYLVDEYYADPRIMQNAYHEWYPMQFQYFADALPYRQW
jgi:hypothetical protein